MEAQLLSLCGVSAVLQNQWTPDPTRAMQVFREMVKGKGTQHTQHMNTCSHTHRCTGTNTQAGVVVIYNGYHHPTKCPTHQVPHPPSASYATPCTLPPLGLLAEGKTVSSSYWDALKAPPPAEQHTEREQGDVVMQGGKQVLQQEKEVVQGDEEVKQQEHPSPADGPGLDPALKYNFVLYGLPHVTFTTPS